MSYISNDEMAQVFNDLAQKNRKQDMTKNEYFDKKAEEHSAYGREDIDDRIGAEIDFTAGAECGYQYAIEKACKWLDENVHLYIDDDAIDEALRKDIVISYHSRKFIKDFRKAMND